MAENHYLMKYKGTYRILAELDKNTNDIPRNSNGEIATGYDDLYISCQYGNKIFTYGHDTNGRMLLTAYIPSIGRGRNIKKTMDEQGIAYTNYVETDEEVEFRFKAKDIESIARLLKAKTSGANISPFSSKNLPKSKVEIPTDEIQRYKEIIALVPKDDLLIIHKITTTFLESVLQKKCKKNNKEFNYKIDMKKMCMGRQTKEYIREKGFWEEYLVYLQKEIKKYN